MNKIVLITGSSGGIGSACVSLFRRSDWHTVGIDVIDVESEKNNCDVFFKADVSNSKELSQIEKYFEKEKYPLICLVNNAAIQIEKKLVETNEDEWDRVLSVNLKSVFLMSKMMYRFMGEGSSIINISSVHANNTSVGLASYVASKGGVSALTRAMSLEMAVKMIRVNAILPGAIETEMLNKGLVRNGNPDTAKQKLMNNTPLKRIGNPVDVAHLALFLADPEKAGNITGQEFICDGGITARLASE